MKKVTTILAAILLMAVGATAQKLSYSAVVRNSDNELVVNANLTVAVSIANSNGGAVVYSETHNVTTNQNGLVTLTIGDGTGVTGSMSDVTWQTAFITSDYTLPNGSHVVNTTPVTAVPYALYAEKSGSSAASSASIDGGAVNFSMPISDFVNNLTDEQKAELCTALGCSGGGGEPGTEPTTFTCGTSTVKDVDNNTYHTVQIGTQCWMKENMRCTHYSTPTVTEVYASVAAGSETTYGRLYDCNTATAMGGSHGICPEGWHVPTKAEFQIMMVASGLTTTDYQSYTPANLLTTGAWNSSGIIGSPGHSNETSFMSDFSALPAGVMFLLTYFYRGERAIFWTASNETVSSSSAVPVSLTLKFDSQNAEFGTSMPDVFASVRCVKDN
ncbi:MAG: fibrobacter succinogenes major paralogous domain-containing protein [Bacteroidales bacterium]|nr:fibrobacter succinogenes major paralogous domain-containing protein [Bacteroidales bacterium]